jgi:hypothetical protein
MVFPGLYLPNIPVWDHNDLVRSNHRGSCRISLKKEQERGTHFHIPKGGYKKSPAVNISRRGSVFFLLVPVVCTAKNARDGGAHGRVQVRQRNYMDVFSF